MRNDICHGIFSFILCLYKANFKLKTNIILFVLSANIVLLKLSLPSHCGRIYKELSDHSSVISTATVLNCSQTGSIFSIVFSLVAMSFPVGWPCSCAMVMTSSLQNTIFNRVSPLRSWHLVVVHKIYNYQISISSFLHPLKYYILFHQLIRHQATPP